MAGRRAQPANEAGAGIAEAELFRKLAPERLARIRERLIERRFARGEVLFYEGQPAEALWVVRRGRVRLYRATADGRVTTLDTLGPGRIFGAISPADETYPASAEAMTAGSAWRLPRSVLLHLLSEDPSLGIEVLRIVSSRLREAHTRLCSFAHQSASARLARALLQAAPEGEARVTRRALAETAGTTVETAIRVLRRFEREGLVRGEVGCLHVLDAEGLRRVAEHR